MIISLKKVNKSIILLDFGLILFDKLAIQQFKLSILLHNGVISFHTILMRQETKGKLLHSYSSQLPNIFVTPDGILILCN